MNDDASRRKANRLNVAASRSVESPPPGMSGAEVVALAKLRKGLNNPGRGRTEFEGGWQARVNRLRFGAGDER